MNKIELRGVLVGAGLDMDFLQDYIEKGVFTPESRVRQELAEAKGDLEVYINSQGGSVIAANEMINAIRDYKKAGNKVSVTIGALAASMGADLAFLIGADSVQAHRNSRIMFHSAASITEGGPEAHTDRAALLESMNNDTKAWLIANTDIDPDKIEEMFKEGREGWFSAEEAKNLKLIDEIIDAEAMMPRINSAGMSVLKERGVQFAALSMEPDDADKSVEQVVFERELGDLQRKLNFKQGCYNSVIQENGQLSTKVETLTGEKEKLTRQVETLTGEKKAAEDALQKARTRADQAEAKLGKFAAGLVFGEGGEEAPATFAAAVRQLREENPTWTQEKAWQKAKEDFPQLWEKAKG